MSKRVSVTLPDGIADALERWAISEQNKSATLAAFLVESAVRDAQAKGLIPPEQDLKKAS
jgi:CopG-like RHH_1 or ribbon-helix-helix domain, RHH_5